MSNFIAPWRACRPEQIEPVNEIMGWHLSDQDKTDIDDILKDTITDQADPEFMAPPTRDAA